MHRRSEVVRHDGIDHRARDAMVPALSVQFIRHGLALSDQGEVVAEDTFKTLDLVVPQMGLRDVQRTIGQRAVVIVGDGDHSLNGKAVVATDKGI